MKKMLSNQLFLLCAIIGELVEVNYIWSLDIWTIMIKYNYFHTFLEINIFS